jgi:shikimate kinase
MSLVLIGMMGSGKTTVGRQAAFRLSWEFVDLDRVITENAAMDISSIFEIEGEAGFRSRETDALRSLLPASERILAAGGGTPTIAENWPLIRAHGTVVHLAADVESMLTRVQGKKKRPMLGDDPAGAIERLAGERGKWYALADAVIDTTGRTVDSVIDEVVRLARESE